MCAERSAQALQGLYIQKGGRWLRLDSSGRLQGERMRPRFFYLRREQLKEVPARRVLRWLAKGRSLGPPLHYKRRKRFLAAPQPVQGQGGALEPCVPRPAEPHALRKPLAPANAQLAPLPSTTKPPEPNPEPITSTPSEDPKTIVALPPQTSPLPRKPLPPAKENIQTPPKKTVTNKETGRLKLKEKSSSLTEYVAGKSQSSPSKPRLGSFRADELVRIPSRIVASSLRLSGSESDERDGASSGAESVKSRRKPVVMSRRARTVRKSTSEITRELLSGLAGPKAGRTSPRKPPQRPAQASSDEDESDASESPPTRRLGKNKTSNQKNTQKRTGKTPLRKRVQQTTSSDESESGTRSKSSDDDMSSNGHTMSKSLRSAKKTKEVEKSSDKDNGAKSPRSAKKTRSDLSITLRPVQTKQGGNKSSLWEIVPHSLRSVKRKHKVNKQTEEPATKLLRTTQKRPHDTDNSSDTSSDMSSDEDLVSKSLRSGQKSKVDEARSLSLRSVKRKLVGNRSSDGDSAASSSDESDSVKSKQTSSISSWGRGKPPCTSSPRAPRQPLVRLRRLSCITRSSAPGQRLRLRAEPARTGARPSLSDKENRRGQGDATSRTLRERDSRRPRPASERDGTNRTRSRDGRFRRTLSERDNKRPGPASERDDTRSRPLREDDGQSKPVSKREGKLTVPAREGDSNKGKKRDDTRPRPLREDDGKRPQPVSKREGKKVVSAREGDGNKGKERDGTRAANTAADGGSGLRRPPSSHFPPPHPRAFSPLEDQAILAYVQKGGRSSNVNGNALWKHLQDEWRNLSGNTRTWQSLRNRYLRYLLPALHTLPLLPAVAQRLRATAATGSLKLSRKRTNSLLADEGRGEPQGAWSRRPRPVLAATPTPLGTQSPTARRSGGRRGLLPLSLL